MMNPLRCLWIALPCLGLGPDSSAQENMEDRGISLDAMVPAFSARDIPLSEAIDRLRGAGLRICFEEGLGVPMPQVTCEATRESAWSILDALVPESSPYTWSKSPQYEIVNVYPRSGTALNWMVEKISVKQMKLMDFVGSRSDLRMEQHHIGWPYRGPSWLPDWPVTILAVRQTAWECLNAAVDPIPNLYWTIHSFPDGKSISFLCIP